MATVCLTWNTSASLAAFRELGWTSRQDGPKARKLYYLAFTWAGGASNDESTIVFLKSM